MSVADPNGSNTASTAIVAHYEYDAYGNAVTASAGDYADDNPFRFSTKYWDDETGFGYWGYRYYDPRLGRWTTRDPIDEEGGANLYAFVYNDATDSFDPFGMRSEDSGCCCCCAEFIAAEFVQEVHGGERIPYRAANGERTFTVPYTTFGLHFDVAIGISNTFGRGGDCKFEWWETAQYSGDFFDYSFDWQEQNTTGKYLMTQVWGSRPSPPPCEVGHTITIPDAPMLPRFRYGRAATSTKDLDISVLVTSGCTQGCRCRVVAIDIFVRIVVRDGRADKNASYISIDPPRCAD